MDCLPGMGGIPILLCVQREVVPYLPGQIIGQDGPIKKMRP